MISINTPMAGRRERGAGRALLFIPLAVFALVAVFLWRGIGKDPTLLPSAKLNQLFPEFSLSTLHDPGSTIDNQLISGAPSLVNVWATWCPSCRVEHPYLMKLAENEGVRIIGLNYKDERDEAIRWLEQLGDPYALHISDPEGKLGFDLGVYGAPETYVIDARNVVRHRHVGVVDERLWKETLQPLLASIAKETEGEVSP